MIRLGINVDHVATLRQARGTTYPDPVAAAIAAIRGGADQITIHLREDRRHIQDADVWRMRKEVNCILNLEMAAAPEIVDIACNVRPDVATLVPEKREELTTEGGLDVAGSMSALRGTVSKLKSAGIIVSLFIDPDVSQVEASVEVGADAIELHTGAYCDATTEDEATAQMDRLVNAARFAATTDLTICAGHGINYSNAWSVAKFLPEVKEYNIGHAIVAESVYVGMEQAVREMKDILLP
jgi:pyridoxine 5-phosphate synthase